MSDDGQSGGGYKFEYAGSARAGCKGPKPCKGTKITKNELRFGSVADFQGHTSWSWRHYGCITPKILTNIKNKYANAEEVEGFDTLTDEDKSKIKAAWEAGKVADEDIPASAKKTETTGENGEGAPKKQATRPRKRAKQGSYADDDEDDEPKPKKKAVRGRKKKAPSDDDDAEVSDAEEGGESDYGAGKKRKRAPAKRSPAKKKTKASDDAEEGDDVEGAEAGDALD